MLCESIHQEIETPQEEQVTKVEISQHTQSCANLTLLDMGKCSCDNTDEWEDLPF